MAGSVNRPLPAVPVAESDYVDAGFDEDEFSDGEDYENDGLEVGSSDDDHDYVVPETSAQDKPALPPRQPTWVRTSPPPPGQTNATPVCPPRNRPQPSQQQVLPPRRTSASLPSEKYKAPQQPPQEVLNERVSRPALPAPMQPQEMNPPPEVGADPTGEYEIPVGMDPNQRHNTPLPPQIPDDLYSMPENMPEIPNMSSMQKEILAKKLATSTRELPPTPQQQKEVNGFRMVKGVDTLIIKDAKSGLRPVAKDVFEQKSPKRESSAPDPSVMDFRVKTAMFGQKMAPHTTLRQPQTVIRDKVRGSTTSNISNRSDSGVDMDDITPKSPSTLHHTASTRPPTSSMLHHTTSTRPPTQSAVPIAKRTLPPLPPAEETTAKSSLSSRCLPNVPHSSTEDLSKYPWFFGSLDRPEEISKIKALRQDGAYLVRNSTKTDPKNPYTLCILYKGRIRHLRLRNRSDGKFAIGSEKQDEECFNTVPELIQHHRQYCIILAGQDGEGGETRLIKHPQK